MRRSTTRLVVAVAAWAHLGARALPLPWGKKPCQDLLASIKSQSPPLRLGEGRFELHPLRDLRWTLPTAASEPPTDAAAPEAPRAVDFEAANSACHVFAATGVDWPRAFALARRLEAADEAPDEEAFAVGWRGAEWLVRDARSLEVVVAHACLDRRCAVRLSQNGAGVALDAARADPILRRAGAPPAALVDAEPPKANSIRASALANTRDLEAPIWPKAYHFAKLFAAGEREDRFGAVPVRRLRNGLWAAGSRHRTTAALLAAVDVPIRRVSRGNS